MPARAVLVIVAVFLCSDHIAARVHWPRLWPRFMCLNGIGRLLHHDPCSTRYDSRNVDACQCLPISLPAVWIFFFYIFPPTLAPSVPESLSVWLVQTIIPHLPINTFTPAGPLRHAGKCLPTGHHVCFGLIAACWAYFFFEVSLIKLFFWAVDVPDLTGVGGLSQQNYPFKSLNQDLEQTQGLLTITLITISWRNIKFLLQSGSDSSNGCDNVAEVYLVRGF